jgi:uncharacterized protein (UPF0261 family)/ABC-type branched-subunit amino acid transport system ATPase component
MVSGEVMATTRSDDAAGKGTQTTAAPMLAVTGLDVHYGRAHALQAVSLTLKRGVLAVLGRNGMGKTTLCNAVTGMLPATALARGKVTLMGREVLGLAANTITDLGIGYVPQGRRVWPSLTVDEHLRLASRSARRGEWTVERVYELFPRLGERKRNGGAQLSGGEQQMLAIGRALLFNPRVLVMDEPTEGLAPVIVEQVAATLKSLAGESEIAVLLIEQNIGVAVDVADRIAVMVNGRIAREMSAPELAGDRELQQRLLGIHGGVEADAGSDLSSGTSLPASEVAGANEPVSVYVVRRQGGQSGAEVRFGDGEQGRRPPDPAASPPGSGFTRWGQSGAGSAGNVASALQDQDTRTESSAFAEHEAASTLRNRESARVVEFPVAATSGRAAYIVGTFDTKGRELFFLKNCMDKLGLRTVTVDLSTSGATSTANIHPREVARHHPGGERAVFTGDRGSAVTAMALALERFILTRRDLGGVISAGGSGGTALATQAMRALPIGLPKLMVSTMASGDVRPYVGPNDICMMYSVTDVSGINRISEQVLANAAHALAGMIAYRRHASSETRPAIGLTMFGVTTTCVQSVTKQLQEDYDCLVFHATGTGGQSMEKLVDSGLLAGVIDVATTEVCDEIAGGVLSAGATRMDAMSRVRVPYVGSCGALDMANFYAWDTVPAKYSGRNLYRHNPNVTLMRTTAEECKAIGEFIGRKLNAMVGPVRFVIPEGGVSALDAPGKAFWDPDADKALFGAIESVFRAAPDRRLLRSPLHINAPAFADLLVAQFKEIAGSETRRVAGAHS